MLEIIEGPLGREEGGCGRSFEAKDRAAVSGSMRKSWIREGIILAFLGGEAVSGDRVGLSPAAYERRFPARRQAWSVAAGQG